VDLDNSIGADGAKAIAKAMKVNESVTGIHLNSEYCDT
jgi:hypothetical protein